MFLRNLTATFAAPCITALCWMALFSPYLAAQRPADVILHNGKILTVDKSFSIAQAIALQGNQIVAVGQNQQVMALSGPNTRVLDLKGRTVIPGIFDTHEHVYAGSESNYGGELSYDDFKLYPIDWAAVTTVQDVLNQVSGLMAKYKWKPGEWIQFAQSGTGATNSSVKIMTDGLSAKDLDKVTPDNPVVMGFNWPALNGLLANSKAIDIIWAEHGDFIKKYGRYWIDSTGRPEGHMESPATWLFLEPLPKPSPEILAALYTEYSQELNAQGVTGVATWMVPYAIDTYKLLESRGQALIRIAYGLERPFLPKNMDLAKGFKEIAKTLGTGTDLMWVDAISTGAIDGAGTRMCTSPPRVKAFSNLDDWWPMGQCLQDIEYRGAKGKAAPIQGNYFGEWLEVLARDGARLANQHAAGDRTVTMLLNTLEAQQKLSGPNWKPANGKGWGFDHCNMVNPADLPRAAKLGVIFSCSITVDQGAEIANAFGDKVANTFPSPFKSMMNAGVIAGLEQGDFMGIEQLITRKDENGKVWSPQDRLTREEALRTATWNGAAYALRQDKVGSLEIGKLADLVVLDKDYLTIPETSIHTIAPQLTMMDGKMVFAHPDFAAEYNLKMPGVTVATLQSLQARHKRGMSRR